MVVVLHDWDYSEQYVDSWVREQLINLGLDPDGVDNAQLWGCAIVRVVDDGWLAEYHPLEAIVEHSDPTTGVHATLYSCPWCSRLTDHGVCPHCGADIINTPGPEAEYQSAEDIAEWFAFLTPETVAFRCEYCDGVFGVEQAIQHAVSTDHTQFHRIA
jgi:hypothetical protein